MTNQEILQRFQTVQQAIEQDVFSTTKIKYALTSNSKRLEDAIEPYQDEMDQLREEYKEELQELQDEREELQERFQNTDDPAEKEEINEEFQEVTPPDEFMDARQELLEMEAGDPEPYNVNDTYLDDEEDVDIEFLYRLDWMFVDEL